MEYVYCQNLAANANVSSLSYIKDDFPLSTDQISSMVLMQIILIYTWNLMNFI